MNRTSRPVVPPTVRHPTWRAVAASVVLAPALAVGLAACGGGSSGSVAPVGAPPTDASQEGFCKTFTELGADVTPAEAAQKLGEVGTPSDIGPSQRHGFEVLLQHLSRLPDDSNDAALTQMTQGLKASDQADVRAFLTYYADECQG